MAREININQTAGEIATRWPELLPVLEEYRIDYCCGGRKPLAESAARAGVDPQELVERLAGYEAKGTGEPPRDWSKATMTELADNIEQTHHAYTRESLGRLDTMLTKCVAAHADDEPRLVELQQTVASMTEDLHDHMIREERVLFPWLRRLERRTEIQGGPPWSVKRPIDCMVHDHDELGAGFERIQQLTDGLAVPENACSTWRACYAELDAFERDTREHIHKENNILFPAGVAAEVAMGGHSGWRARSQTDARADA
jgi:regulator of cell morphogenesis and NO signaling